MTSVSDPARAADPPAGKRSRGRPAHTESEISARRQQIIEAAYEVFTDKGYHDAAISDIAARIGAGHGTIYRYFDNKRDILDHVIEYGVARLMDSLSIVDITRADSVAELRVQLTRLGDGLFSQVVDNDPGLPRLLLLEAAAIDAEMLHRLLGMMETAIAAIAVSLGQAVDRGFLRPGLDAPSAARALCGCLASAFLAEARMPGLDTGARRRYVDTVVSFLIDNVEPGTAR